MIVNTMLKCIHRFIPYYYEYLPPFLLNSIFCSYLVGLDVKSVGSLDKFQNMVSYPTFGIVFGILYPITYPVCAGYTLYKLNIKQK